MTWRVLNQSLSMMQPAWIKMSSEPIIRMLRLDRSHMAWSELEDAQHSLCYSPHMRQSPFGWTGAHIPRACMRGWPCVERRATAWGWAIRCSARRRAAKSGWAMSGGAGRLARGARPFAAAWANTGWLEHGGDKVSNQVLGVLLCERLTARWCGSHRGWGQSRAHRSLDGVDAPDTGPPEAFKVSDGEDIDQRWRWRVWMRPESLYASTP
jgi:hypothetical protein